MVNKIGVKEKKLYGNKRGGVKVEFKDFSQRLKSILLCFEFFYLTAVLFGFQRGTLGHSNNVRGIRGQ